MEGHKRCIVLFRCSLLSRKTTKTTFTTSNNSFVKPCAELSLLKLCHGEKECHEMEQLREDKTRYACIQSFCKVNNQKQQLRQDNITTAFPAKGNLVVKYCKCCICCLFLLPFLVLCYYPNPPFFRMIHFCARRDVDYCALYHGISSSYSTQIFIFLLFCSQNWPLGQSY